MEKEREREREGGGERGVLEPTLSYEGAGGEWTSLQHKEKVVCV